MTTPLIDCLQYAQFSASVFEQMHKGGVHAVHVTIAYHENFREMVLNLEQWNRWFEQYPEWIFKGVDERDITEAVESNRTAIFFGFQNPSPIEDDIGLIEICHQLGIRFMQLTYNNQSLLATGCYEDEDTGLTRFGRQVVREMNRVGMVIDMSHSADRSTLDAIESSQRPIAITHANPHWWHPARRNKTHEVIKALTSSGGMLGFSLYPHHLKGGSQCKLDDFCTMILDCAERYGVEHLGIGSDLCQDQPDSVVTWMRNGRWSKDTDYGEGTADNAGFPPHPSWFNNNTHLVNIKNGLLTAGMNDADTKAVMGGNWRRFFASSFKPG
ncbi:MAG: dipeptidase [Acidiferrobacterales bacterium]|nr:dipeptidase [Acidiferrobacterales bacterium]